MAAPGSHYHFRFTSKVADISLEIPGVIQNSYGIRAAGISIPGVQRRFTGCTHRVKDISERYAASERERFTRHRIPSFPPNEYSERSALNATI